MYRKVARQTTTYIRQRIDDSFVHAVFLALAREVTKQIFGAAAVELECGDCGVLAFVFFLPPLDDEASHSLYSVQS